MLYLSMRSRGLISVELGMTARRAQNCNTKLIRMLLATINLSALMDPDSQFLN